MSREQVGGRSAVSTSGWEGTDWRWGGKPRATEQREAQRVRAQAIFLALAGQEKKKRGSKHESLNFFFFPLGSHWSIPPSQLPKWGALNVSARTDHLLLQPKPPSQAGPTAEMARKWQERCLLQARAVGLARAGGDNACQTPRRRPLSGWSATRHSGTITGWGLSFFLFY